jgi:cyclopropane fatty-acyl-phospholipid synthase-like methyltransferase
MDETIYTDGRYLARNPTWHVEDSPWKARQILRMLQRNRIEPKTIGEVGCGAGEILRQLQRQMDRSCEFCGYDISPQAIQLCQSRANDRLHFELMDRLQETDARFDLLLMIDFIEHLEDYYGFLRAVKPRSRYKVLHIPLDLCVQAVLRPRRLPWVRQVSGHLHYFTKDTAIQSLKDAGYEVLDCFLTRQAMESTHKILKTYVGNSFRRFTSLFSDDLAARIFGGFGLLVLAQ